MTPLASALDELLRAGPATPTQLQQHLANAGAQIGYEAIVAALRQLQSAGRVTRHASGTWYAMAGDITAADVPQETTMADTIECQRCGEEKPPGEMLQRHGKPSKTCRACFEAAKAGKRTKVAPTKAAAKSVRAEKSAPAPKHGIVVSTRITIELQDADGEAVRLTLERAQALQLAEVLGDALS